jgi:ABC-2 type transport system permease protein
MRRIFAIFKALLKEWLRSKSGVFFSFLFPLMLLLIFGTIFGSQGDTSYMLHIQNLDREDGTATEISQQFIGVLNSMEIFEIKELEPNVDVDTYVKDNPSFEYSYRVLVIPQGFETATLSKSMEIRMNVVSDTFSKVETYFGSFMGEEELQNLKEGQQQMNQARKMFSGGEGSELTYLAQGNDISSGVIQGVLQSVITAFNNQLIGTQGGTSISITTDSLAEEGMNATDYYIPGLIAAFIMTNGILGATITITEYRRNGTLKRLAATPLPKSSWILGNLLEQGVLAFVLTAVMVAAGWIIFDVHALPGPYALALIFVGSVAFSGMAMVLSGVIKDVEAASGAANAIAFPMMFLSGAFWPVEMMPSYMQTIAKALPLYYFHDGLRELMIFGNLSKAVVPFLIMGVLAVAFIGIGTVITKWKEF